MSDPHWHVLGAGAIGCLFATALHRHGIGTTLILRDGKEPSPTPVTIQRQHNSETNKLAVFSRRNDEKISHLLVTTKAYDVCKAVAAMAPHLTNHCQIVLLVNGMGMAQQLQVMLPKLDIFCATTTEGAYAVSPRHIAHAGTGETRIGRSGQRQPAAPWFDQWSKAIDNSLWDDQIEQALWSKLAVNCVINPLAALHRCPNGDLAGRPELAREVTGLCEEVTAISRAAGFSDLAATLPQTVARVIASTAANRCSMLQDVEAGRPTEIDYITGYLLQVAVSFGIDAPRNTALLERIKQC